MTARTILGVQDCWYEQVRNLPDAVRGMSALPTRVRRLGTDGVDVASAIEPYLPRNLGQTVFDRIEAARQRREDFAERGERITRNWRDAAPVKDVDALVRAVRRAAA